jgi:hypothetical protein
MLLTMDGRNGRTTEADARANEAEEDRTTRVKWNARVTGLGGMSAAWHEAE